MTLVIVSSIYAGTYVSCYLALQPYSRTLQDEYLVLEIYQKTAWKAIGQIMDVIFISSWHWTIDWLDTDQGRVIKGQLYW